MNGNTERARVRAAHAWYLAALILAACFLLCSCGSDKASESARVSEPDIAAETAAPAPTPTPVPAYMALNAAPVAVTKPDASKFRYQYDLYSNGSRLSGFSRDEAVYFDSGENYTSLEGIVTFRGDNFRQNAAYGTAALKHCDFKNLWKRTIGKIDSGYAVWSGVGWTGQPVMVRWPDELRTKMNINREFISDSELVEVIYGTLDGKIYFLDARTGKETRSPINLGFPIKGSVSVDPRGYPLLYVGQGISVANGVTGKIGWRVYSLLDQKELYFLDGQDSRAYRKHGSFDGTCIVNGVADTAFVCGENGILYCVKLNTVYDPAAPYINVKPQVTSYRYKSAPTSEYGIENSVAAYGQYIWFADNGGLITCLDVNTMRAVWLFDMGDDVDSSLALEEKDGVLSLYAVNQVDKQGDKGFCTICRLDALSGKEYWRIVVGCSSDGTNGGGGFASPAIGKGAYADYVYFNICQTDERGTLYCLDKRTGKTVWSKGTSVPSWSSPVLVYREDGTGVLVVCNSGGRGVVTMYDPKTGKRFSHINLDGKIECSPAVFNDILVLGTRDCRLYGLKLT